MSDIGQRIENAKQRAQALTRPRNYADKYPVRKDLSDYGGLLVEPLRGAKQEAVSSPDNRLEQVRTYKGSTSIAVGAIARTIAMKEPQVQVKRMTKSGIRLFDVPEDHPLKVLLRTVNALHTQWDLWFYMVGYRLLTGASYTWTPRNGFDVPSELWPLPSPWVFPVPSQEEFVAAYDVKAIFGDQTRLPARDVLEIQEPAFDWSGNRRYFGKGKQGQSEDMVFNENAMLTRMHWHFKNFAPPALHYETDDPLDDEALRNHHVQISSQHTLAQHTGRPVISHSGLKLKQDLSKSPREMDYNTSLEMAMEWILAVYGVPKAVAGITTDVNRANMVGAMLAFATRTINPLLDHLSKHLTKSLASQFDDDLIIRFRELTVNDKEQIRKDAQTAHTAGAIDIDEIRDVLLDLPPFKTGGNRVLIPQGKHLSEFGNVEAGEENPEPPKTGAGGTNNAGNNRSAKDPVPEDLTPQGDRANDSSVKSLSVSDLFRMMDSRYKRNTNGHPILS